MRQAHPPLSKSKAFKLWRTSLFIPSYRVFRAGAVVSISALLAACAALPTNGPTAGQITHAVKQPDNGLGMALVDISAPMISKLAEDNRLANEHVATLANLGGGGPALGNDVVGPGDILSIGVYEVGVGLFGGMTPTGDSLYPAARGEEFAAVPVDRNGAIKLPYIGELTVTGHTPAEIAHMIERGYADRSQSPQALVILKKNMSNTVYVTGDIRKPGRIELSLRGERLLSAIAEAGGTVSQTQDMVVRVTRDGEVVEERLDRIRAGAANDIVLHANDVVELIKEPQTYTVFGAVTKVTQVPFDQTELTLAEAIARAGGPNDALANPKAIFLFRYVHPLDGGEAKPTIYRLNLMQPQSYFLSQKFVMQDKDVLYISNANINRASKFVGILNQLFSPFITARALSQ